jgi:hypothetical protein
MYFLFAGKNYYPDGGMQDLVGMFRSVEQARAFFDNPGKDEDGYEIRFDWYQIATVDADGRLVLVEGYDRCRWTAGG